MANSNGGLMSTLKDLRTVLAALAVTALTAGTATAADRIDYAWPGALSSGIAPFTFADDLGYFKQENITFDVVVLAGSGVIIPQLMAGTIFSAYSTLDPLIVSRQPGKPDFDFRFVYNAVRNSIWEISVLDTSPIRSIKDLGGKTIGVGALTFGNVPMTKAILKEEGVDPATVPLVAVGVGVPAFQALRSGKIDALNLYDIMNVLLQQQGTKIRILPFPPQFTDVSSHGFPVTNKMIRERPDLVAGFGRAVAKGTVACIANPEGCLQSYWKHYPELKPAGDEAAAIKHEMPLLQTRLKNMTIWHDGQPHKYGLFSDQDFTTDIASLRVGGVIGDSEIKLDTLFTNQFVDDYNKFDAAAVEKTAKAYKP
jgi:NitT/TauT family transport system substrate-binding protein